MSAAPTKPAESEEQDLEHLVMDMTERSKIYIEIAGALEARLTAMERVIVAMIAESKASAAKKGKW